MPPLRITAVPLTPTAFAPFGTVIEPPSSPSTSTAATVNQGTASKHPRISPLTSTYPTSSPTATPNINLFICAPRSLDSNGAYHCALLERHPYTTQSFIPMGLPAAVGGTAYLVIVAEGGEEGPRIEEGSVKAFWCNGGQGVTYGVGTWHAPMVVLGEESVRFVVVCYENGTGEDCEERGVEVVVEEGVVGGRAEGDGGILVIEGSV